VPVTNSEKPAKTRARHVDLPRARAAVTELLEALGYDPESDQLLKTPERVADALVELTGGAPQAMSSFPNDGHLTGPVMVRDIAFISLCEHHLLPFQGRAHIAYIPRERIGGFSGFAHVVEMFANNLGLQETLTVNIANYIMAELDPLAVGVVVEAQHMCMAARGIRAREASIVTRQFLGELADDPQLIGAFAVLGTSTE